MQDLFLEEASLACTWDRNATPTSSTHKRKPIRTHQLLLSKELHIAHVPFPFFTQISQVTVKAAPYILSNYT